MRRHGVPVWYVILIIVGVLPVAAYPLILSKWPTADGYEMKLLLWLYPVYVAASGIFAYLCWPERRTESWVLLALMAMSHAAMWSLVVM